MLPDTDAQRAERLVDAIRAGVPGAVGGVHDLHRVTASFGLAIVHDGKRCPMPWLGQMRRSTERSKVDETGFRSRL